ncbi:hypothetical protein EWW49_28320 [Pseudomonas syringae]|nr:hypothetical protein EWW49_28320 [Pseudomonas syringae]
MWLGCPSVVLVALPGVLYSVDVVDDGATERLADELWLTLSGVGGQDFARTEGSLDRIPVHFPSARLSDPRTPGMSRSWCLTRLRAPCGRLPATSPTCHGPLPRPVC